MKDCKYPNCQQCESEDCNMEQRDMVALLKRRRYHANIEQAREKQRGYRGKVKESLPHCDDCKMRVMVERRTEERTQRLCIMEMRLIEKKVSNCLRWCERRKNKRNGEN